MEFIMQQKSSCVETLKAQKNGHDTKVQCEEKQQQATHLPPCPKTDSPAFYSFVQLSSYGCKALPLPFSTVLLHRAITRFNNAMILKSKGKMGESKRGKFILKIRS